MNFDIFIVQLDTILDQFEKCTAKSQYDDLSDLPKSDIQSLVTKSIAAAHRISGTNSSYSKEIDRLVTSLKHLHFYINPVIGVVKALRDDLKSGYTHSIVEIIHSEVFADFLEMADHLCETGYKDAAAVIAGSTLESHLRALCNKAGISVENQRTDGSSAPKKAESMNSDLSSSSIYTKIDQKSITAWLDLRNKAAHGRYDEYSQTQVSIMVSGIRDFIVRNPA